jgi:hypothetical protein
MSLSSIADAKNAISRLREAFLAEILTQTKVIDPSLDVALRVEGPADWTWDGVPPDADVGGGKGHGRGGGGGGGGGKVPKKKRGKKGGGGKEKAPEVEEDKPKEEERIFKLRDIEFDVPRGQLCAIVGPVGSGKSSLLQGLIGGKFFSFFGRTGFLRRLIYLLTEMRRTKGSVTFGGSVGYCPQSAWIQVRPVNYVYHK